MDNPNVSSKMVPNMATLKKKLYHIESMPASSPGTFETSLPSDGKVGENAPLDVSGLAPLDDTVYEANSIYQQQRNLRKQRVEGRSSHAIAVSSSTSSFSTSMSSSRVRHASDADYSALACPTLAGPRGDESRAMTNEFIGRSVTFEDANFNGGLTLPTSASKKKASK